MKVAPRRLSRLSSFLDERRFLFCRRCWIAGGWEWRRPSRMLRKTTERLLARAIPVLYYIRLAGWRVLRPITVGVRVLVVDDGRLLLVRGHGHDHWHLPGGAI